MSSILDNIHFIRKYQRKSALGKAILISFLGQIVSSLTNFGIVFYLVRVMSKAEFGQYSLCFALILLISGLVSASIAVQFVVNLPDQAKVYRANYALHHTVAVGSISVGLIILALFFQFLAVRFYVDENRIFMLALPVTTASAFLTLHDLMARFAFSERRESVVLVNNIFVAAVTGSVFFIAMIGGYPISVALAVYAYGLGHAAGFFRCLYVFKLPWRELDASRLKQAFKDSWAGGRYNIMTSVVYSIRTQAHNFIVAPLIGAAALGEINASRVLVTPALMAINPITQILMPRLSEKRASVSAELTKIAVIPIIFLFFIAFIYSLIILPNLKWLIPLTLGKTYDNVVPLVFAWCIVTMVLSVRNGLTLALEVIRAFKNVFIANTAGAVGAVLFALIFAYTHGGLGAIYALALAEVLLCALLVLVHVTIQRKASRIIKSDPVPETDDNDIPVNAAVQNISRREIK